MTIDFEMLRLALDYYDKGNENLANNLLNVALKDAGFVEKDAKDEDKDIGNDTLHDYGLGGYTDSSDPRSDSASHHSANSMHLIVHQMPDVQYKVVNVEAYPAASQQGGGRHIVTVTGVKSGTVILATGYNGNPEHFDNEIKHTVGQELIVDAKFWEPALGPYAVFIKKNGKIVSDVVGSMGLRGGEHWSFLIEFEEV